jgi:hypothetical protein
MEVNGQFLPPPTLHSVEEGVSLPGLDERERTIPLDEVRIQKIRKAIVHGRVMDWDPWYIPGENYLDGITWQVRFTRDGIEKIVWGENAYPKEWKQIFHEMERTIEVQFVDALMG